MSSKNIQKNTNNSNLNNSNSIFLKIVSILFLAIFASNISLAQEIILPDNTTQNSDLSKMSLEDKIKKASTELGAFFYGNDPQNTIIITGDKLSIEDRLLFKLVRSQITEAKDVVAYTDLEILNNPKLAEGKTLILLGSHRTNYYTKEIIDKELLSESIESDYNPVTLKYGISKEGYRVLIGYSQKEMINNENRAVQVSPLNKFMDQKYVPIAATLFAILMMSLWNLLYNTIMNLFADYSSNKVTDKLSKKKLVSEKKKLHHQKHLRVHELLYSREIIALILSVVVFAAMVAWSWTDTMDNYLNMLWISLIIVAVMTIMKEYIRQKFCYTRKIHVEFIFWPFGTIITAISTYLGNTFSLASYGLVEDNEEDEKKFGKIAFITALFTLLIAILAYIANILYPSLILQLVYVYAILAAFIDMFPMNPMGGNDMRKWKFGLWLFMYIIIIVCYIFMSFTQYI